MRCRVHPGRAPHRAFDDHLTWGAPRGPPTPPTLRTPAEPWRFASVQSQTGPRDGPRPEVRRARRSRGASRVCNHKRGPERAPIPPRFVAPGGAVALRECAITNGAPRWPTPRGSSRPAEPWCFASVQSQTGPRDGLAPPRFVAPGGAVVLRECAITNGAPRRPRTPEVRRARRSRGASRVCNHKRGPEMSHAPRFVAPGGAVALRECAITNGAPRWLPRPEVRRAPAEPWRFASVQSQTGPRDGSHAPRFVAPGGAVALRECAITNGAPRWPPTPRGSSRAAEPWRFASVQSQTGPRDGLPPRRGPRARRSRGASRVCHHKRGPEMASHPPRCVARGGAVALRECAITNGPRDGLPPPEVRRARRSRGASRVCHHKRGPEMASHPRGSSRPGGAVALLVNPTDS